MGAYFYKEELDDNDYYDDWRLPFDWRRNFASCRAGTSDFASHYLPAIRGFWAVLSAGWRDYVAGDSDFLEHPAACGALCFRVRTGSDCGY